MPVGPKTGIKIQRYTETSDGMGGSTFQWTDLIRSLSGTFLAMKARERMGSDSAKIYSTHYFQSKYPKEITITEKDRVVKLKDNSVYEITFVDDLVGRGLVLILELKKVT